MVLPGQAVPTFPFSMFDPVHLGRDEYGAHVHVNLAERNMLLGGDYPNGSESSRGLRESTIACLASRMTGAPT